MGSNFRPYFCILACLITIQVCLGGAPKVSLDLYYESLCPYCSNFIINPLGLPSLFYTGLIDIVDLRLFPWGNARLISNNSYICQHGPTECKFNAIEACAIDAWPNLDDHFPFITCVENLVFVGKYNEWENCFKLLGLDPTPVTTCYKGESGKKLSLKYAALTNALEPPHEYVPWVVVDGEPLLEDYGNFASYICKAYKGPQPSACKDLPITSVARKMVTFRSYEQTAKGPIVMKFWSFITSWIF